MSCYHQMGNDSANLIFDLNLWLYGGSIISPVNATSEEVSSHIAKCRSKLRSSFDVIFDPQLYSPRSERGSLPGWDYFPKDVDTADLSSPHWWTSVADRLVSSVLALKPNAVCSPAMVPRSFTDQYYDSVVNIADHLIANLTGSGIRGILTAIVNLAEIDNLERIKAIASILSRGKASEVYLVFVSDREPRREHEDGTGLKGAMTLIQQLETAGLRVIVGFCSTDLVLWKHAGATSCATGKFFNLRRFTLARFDEPKDGGGQLPYWIEEALLAFVRQTDLIRLEQRDLLSDSSRRNPFSNEILEAVKANRAWLALSWKHFMWWFADVERRLAQNEATAKSLIEVADENWGVIETSSPRLLMEERPNTGSWVREWRRVIEEIASFQNPEASAPHI